MQLPNFSALSSNSRKTDYNSSRSYSGRILNVLLIGLKSGVVLVSAFGVLPIGRIDLTKYLNAPASEFEIIDARMSLDFAELFIFVKINGQVKMLIFDNDVIPEYTTPLLNVAAKHGHLLNTMAYVEDIIQCITESWETVLLEMDNKLTRYASSQPEGTVSADFLELLMFGFPSTELDQFLTR